MTRSLIHLPHWFVAVFVLAACSSPAPTVRHVKPVAYKPVPYTHPAQPKAAPRKPIYETPVYSGVFIKPRKLEPAVEFWRKTYTVWGNSEVVFHDDRYLDVIYEVMELPGFVDEILTDDQREIIRQRRNFWESQLAVLENKWLYNAPFSEYERRILAKLQQTGKPLHSLLHGIADRLRAQRGIRERFMRGLVISERYDRQFRKIFRDHGLPEDLAYLPHVESSFQPAARSSAGAVGMWQFTKGAAKRFMPGGNRVDRRLDPYASAVGAARYLSYAYDKLRDWPAAITSFNHGIGGMKRAQNQVGPDFVRIVENYDSPSFGFASRNYYAQFLAAREIASNPTSYFNGRASRLARQ